MLGESVAEFVDDHCSGTVGCISRDDWSCITASRTNAGLWAHLWQHGQARRSLVLSALPAFG